MGIIFRGELKGPPTTRDLTAEVFDSIRAGMLHELHKQSPGSPGHHIAIAILNTIDENAPLGWEPVR